MTQEEIFETERAKRKEEVLRELANLPIHNEWIAPRGLPIPMRDELIILPLKQNETKTASGIIMPLNGDASNDRKLAVIARIGPLVTLPVRIGMKVWFDPAGRYFRFVNTDDGNEYLLMIQHLIHGAATPETYCVPEFKDKIEKRNDSRREGMARVEADEKRIFETPKGEA